MATIPAGLKTCLRAPAGQTKTLLRGKSDFPRSKPPLSSEESQSPVSGRFRHDANGTPCIWYLFTNRLFTTWGQAQEFQLWTWPQVIRISTLDLRSEGLSPVSPKMRHFSRFVANSQPCRNKSKKFWRKYLEYCPIRCIFAMSTSIRDKKVA